MSFRIIQRLLKLAHKLNIRLKLKYIKLLKYLLYSQISYINTEGIEKIEEYTMELRLCLGEIIKDFENNKPFLNAKLGCYSLQLKKIF